MINEKIIVSEIISHFIEWCEFNEKTKNDIDEGFELYIGQEQYDGLFEIKINRNLNMSDETLEFRSRYKIFINDFNVRFINTEIPKNLGCRAWNCLRSGSFWFFEKDFDDITLSDLVNVFNPNAFVSYRRKKVPLTKEILKLKNMGKKTVKEIKDVIEITYKIDLDEFFKHKQLSDRGLKNES